LSWKETSLHSILVNSDRTSMTYKEAIRYINSFYDYERAISADMAYLNLDRIGKLVRLFGNPQDNYRTIHITGTKGKGSVACMLSYILREAGFRVGLYTSPHMLDARERIQINNKMIEKAELLSLIEDLKDTIKGLKNKDKPTFFEIYTLLAFNFFSSKKVDFGIFEVGMGGRFDATNVVRPIACAIAPISFDHTRELGDDITDIAKEKAEIIKAGSECISASQDTKVMEIISDRCIREGVRLCVVGRELNYKSRSFSEEKELFDIRGLRNTYKNMELSLLGEHQLENGTLAVGLSEVLISRGYDISVTSIRNGIKKTNLPGRCEVVRAKPFVVLDAAHNGASAIALRETISRNFKFKKLIIILAISNNKDIEGICREVSKLADTIIITKAKTKRATPPKKIKVFLTNKNTCIAKNVKEAYTLARKKAGRDDMILITGSFYLIGEAKALFN